MPTINEVIRRVDKQRPNTLEDKEKARWLIQLDGRIYEEATKADAPEVTPPLIWPEDGDKELLVASPYDRMYYLYLTAMVEFSQGEYDAYNNTVDSYEQARAEWRSWYRRTHLPPAVYIKL